MDSELNGVYSPYPYYAFIDGTGHSSTLRGAFITSSESVAFTNRAFVDFAGGALAVQSTSSLSITGCLFYNNGKGLPAPTTGTLNPIPVYSSTSSGGAIYLSSNASATLTRVVFASNAAGGRGGALYTAGSGGQQTMDSTIFAGNFAPYYSAFRVEASSFSLGYTALNENSPNPAQVVPSGVVYACGNTCKMFDSSQSATATSWVSVSTDITSFDGVSVCASAMYSSDSICTFPPTSSMKYLEFCAYSQATPGTAVSSRKSCSSLSLWDFYPQDANSFTAPPSRSPTHSPTCSPTRSPSAAPTLLPDPLHCLNGKLDAGLEADVDCGGECRERRCDLGQRCSTDADCGIDASAVCVDDTYTKSRICSRQPRPHLVAPYSSVGDSISISFDLPTNRIGLEVDEEFDCSQLFPSVIVPTGGGGTDVWELNISATCTFIDDSTVSMAFLDVYSVFLDTAAIPFYNIRVLPGDNLIFAPSSSVSLTPSFASGPEYAQPDLSSPEIIVVSASTPIVPVLFISSPSRIGLCSKITIDASASSGGGGTSMMFEWSLDSLTRSADGSAVDAAERATISDAITATNALVTKSTITFFDADLKPGRDFSISLRVTNVFGNVASTVTTFRKLDSPIPSVKIEGAKSFSFFRKSPPPTLKVSTAFPTSCVGSSYSSETDEMTITWDVVKIEPTGTEVPITPLSNSIDPRLFNVRFPDDVVVSLDDRFAVTATVTLSETKLFSTDSVSLFVAPSPLFVKIVGGDRTVTRNEVVTLDAGSSADPDDDDAELLYIWSCESTGKDAKCPSGGADTSSALVIPAGSLPVGTYIFTVMVSSSSSPVFPKSSSRSSTLQLLQDLRKGQAPVVSISSSTPTTINPDPSSPAVVLLSGSASSASSFQWSVVGKAAPQNDYLSFFAASPKLPLTAIHSLSLVPGRSYTFMLTATDVNSDLKSSATTSLYVNNPPRKGRLDVSPKSGMSGLTTFTFSSSNWIDEDLPLTFSYYYVDWGTGLSRPLLASSLDCLLTTALPSGNPADSYTLVVMGRVSDSYGATREVSQNLIVSEASEGTVGVLLQESIDVSLRAKDGVSIIYSVSLAARIANDSDSSAYMDYLRAAKTSLDLNSRNLDSFAGGLGAVTSFNPSSVINAEAVSFIVSLIGRDDNDRQELQLQQQTLPLATALSLSNVLSDCVHSLAESDNMTLVDQSIGRILSLSLIPAVPLFRSVTLATAHVSVSANAFDSDSLSYISSSFSKTAFTLTSSSASTFGAAVTEISRETFQAFEPDLLSDVVSLSLFYPPSSSSSNKGSSDAATEDPHNGYFHILITLYSSTSLLLLNDTSTLGCSIHKYGEGWISDLCTVRNVSLNTVLCECSESSFMTPARSDDDNGSPNSRRTSLTTEVIDDLRSNVGDAFVRAGVFLITKPPSDFRRQAAILAVLSVIYFVYISFTLYHYAVDKISVRALRARLGKSKAVESAIIVMRDNRALYAKQTPSKTLPVLSFKDSLKTLSSRSDTFYESSDAEGPEVLGGLDLFVSHSTNKTATRGASIASRLVSRHSSVSSIDDEDDGDILTFLAPAHNPPIDPVLTSNPSKTNASSSDDNDGSAATESEALLQQENKLKDMRTNRLNLFFKGMEKEHELYVFVTSRRNLSRSLSSTFEGISPPISPLATASATAVKASKVRFSSSALDFGFSHSATLNHRKMNGAASETLSSSEPALENGVKGMADDDFSSMPHKATVTLTQLLTFLAMAVFFFQEDQSLFRSDRWTAMTRADEEEALIIFFQQILQGVLQVMLTLPVTYFLSRAFRTIDQSRSTRLVFETSVATSKAKFLAGGISYNNAVDLRRSIYEVEGLRRIVRASHFRASITKDNLEAIDFTLNLLRLQLRKVRAKRHLEDTKVLDLQIATAKLSGKYDYSVFKRLKQAHEVELSRAKDVENLLLKLASLPPLRQAMYLKDRRAMTMMGKGYFATFKRWLYHVFIAEKKGSIPDDFDQRTFLLCEAACGVWIIFVTYYIYSFAVVTGPVKTLEAVSSFSVECLVSILIVSPIIILFKYAIIPGIVAGLVEDDVKRAMDVYSRRKERKGLGIASAAASAVANVKDRARAMSHRLSTGGNVFRKSGLGRPTFGANDYAEETGEAGDAVEMTDLNEDGRESRAESNPMRQSQYQHQHAHDDQQQQELADDVMQKYADNDTQTWEEFIDELSGDKYFVDSASGRSTWTAPKKR